MPNRPTPPSARRGAAAIGYALLLGLVASVAVGALDRTGQVVSGLLGTAAERINGVNAATSAPSTPAPAPALQTCVDSGGATWCGADVSDSGGYPTVTSNAAVCADVGLTFDGPYRVPDSVLHAAIRSLKQQLRDAGRSVPAPNAIQDGCGGDSLGADVFAIDGSGVCGRQDRMRQPGDDSGSPWTDYNGGDWWKITRCR